MNIDQGDSEALQDLDPPEMRQMRRRPNESERAHAARMAYLRLPPGERSIANAYRAVRGIPATERVRVPGNFNKWVREHRWREYAAAYDSADQGLTADLQAVQLTDAEREKNKRAEELAAIEQTAIDQAKETQELYARELAALRSPSGLLGWLGRLLPGWKGRRTAQLANLAAASKDSLITGRIASSDTASLGDTALPQLPAPPDSE